MLTMSGSVSVAANAVTGNLLANEQFKYIPPGKNRRVDVYMSGAAAGLLTSLNIGGRSLVSEATIPPTNRFPLQLEDGINSSPGRPGEEIFLRARNSTGGAIVVNWLVIIR